MHRAGHNWRDLAHAQDKNTNGGTSLVVQWMWIYLPMQETQVWSWSGKIPHALEQLSLYSTDTAARRPLLFYLWVKKKILYIESERIWKTLVTVGNPLKEEMLRAWERGLIHILHFIAYLLCILIVCIFVIWGNSVILIHVHAFLF